MFVFDLITLVPHVNSFCEGHQKRPSPAGTGARQIGYGTCSERMVPAREGESQVMPLSKLLKSLVAIMWLIAPSVALCQNGDCQKFIKAPGEVKLLSDLQESLLFGREGLRDLIGAKFLTPALLKAQASLQFTSIDAKTIEWDAPKRSVIDAVITQLVEKGNLRQFIAEFEDYLKSSSRGLNPQQADLLVHLSDQFSPIPYKIAEQSGSEQQVKPSLTRNKNEALFGENGLRAVLAKTFGSTSLFKAEASLNFESIDRDGINWNGGKLAVIDSVINQLVGNGKIDSFFLELRSYFERKGFSADKLILLSQITNQYAAD